MKKFGFAVLLVMVAMVAPMLGSAVAQDYSVYNEDLYDSDGYNYGVNFYVDNYTGSELYVNAYITSQENVNGDCIYGTLLLAPYETGAMVGSFVTADYNYSWSVNIETNAAFSPETLAAPPY